MKITADYVVCLVSNVVRTDYIGHSPTQLPHHRSTVAAKTQTKPKKTKLQRKPNSGSTSLSLHFLYPPAHLWWWPEQSAMPSIPRHSTATHTHTRAHTYMMLASVGAHAQTHVSGRACTRAHGSQSTCVIKAPSAAYSAIAFAGNEELGGGATFCNEGQEFEVGQWSRFTIARQKKGCGARHARIRIRVGVSIQHNNKRGRGNL